MSQPGIGHNRHRHRKREEQSVSRTSICGIALSRLVNPHLLARLSFASRPLRSATLSTNEIDRPFARSSFLSDRQPLISPIHGLCRGSHHGFKSGDLSLRRSLLAQRVQPVSISTLGLIMLLTAVQPALRVIVRVISSFETP